MKAAVFAKPGEALTIQDVDRPSIGETEMLLQVKRCGICGTDIHASREGPFLAPANTVFGHEFSGEVIEIGTAIADGTFVTGDRVTSLPFIGDKTIGLGEIPGAYSEYVKVGHELVVKIPSELSDLQGALVEPMAVGLHSVKMAGSVAEKNVLIIGAGPIGLACAIWCRFFGANKVVISELSPARLGIAKAFQFKEFVDPSGDVAAQFQALVGTEPELQFECVGAPGFIQHCIERAPKGGVIMGIGVCDHPDTIIPLIAFAKELQIRWAVAYEKEDFEFTMRMMVEGRIDPEPMVTDIVALSEVPEIFEKLRQPTKECKVIIDLTR